MIYFIRCQSSGLTKVGTASCVLTRLKSLQTGSGSRLRVVAVLPGGFKAEARWHADLATHREHGEWFRLGEKQVPPTPEEHRALLGVTAAEARRWVWAELRADLPSASGELLAQVERALTCGNT